MNEKKTYAMPEVTIGMSVLWYQDGNKGTRPFCAFVINVGTNSLNLYVVSPDSSQRLKTGVRHLSDPDAMRAEVINDSGTWDYTEETKRLHLVERQLSQLIERLDQVIGEEENKAVDSLAMA